jgi:hypothetical protein
LAGVWDPQYTLRFDVVARNALNHTNLATPVGNVNSPLFGQSNALAGTGSPTGANREINLQVQLIF